MSKFYEDLGKDQRDLLEKGFPNNSTFKVTVESKTADGVSITASGVRSLKTKKDKSVAEEVVGSVEPKFECKQYNLEVNSKLSTTNNYESELVFKDLGTAGTKVSFKGKQEAENGLTTVGNVSFKNENVAVKGSATYPFSANRPLKLNLNTVFHYSKFLLGLNADYDAQYQKEDKFDKLVEVEPSTTVNGTIAYLGDTYETHLSVKNFPAYKGPRDNQFALGWYQKLSSSVKYGLGFSLDQSQTKGPQAVVGGEYKLDDYTSLKGKFEVKSDYSVDSDLFEFRVGLGATQRINSRLTTTVGADVNVRKLLGTNIGADPSFGFEAKFS